MKFQNLDPNTPYHIFQVIIIHFLNQRNLQSKLVIYILFWIDTPCNSPHLSECSFQMQNKSVVLTAKIIPIRGRINNPTTEKWIHKLTMSFFPLLLPSFCILLETFCTKSLFTLPQIEPVIKNPDLVHHMLLYRCPSFVLEPYDRPCYMGDEGDACFGVVAAWAVGGGVRTECLVSECLHACCCMCFLCV